MIRAFARPLLLALTITIAVPAGAGVVMCTDPVTGKKTFTDKACPTAGTGKRVKIQPTNFGQRRPKAVAEGAWASDRDTSVAGRANFTAREHGEETAHRQGYLPTES